MLMLVSAVLVLGRLPASAKIFNHVKLWSVAGLTLGFCLWFFRLCRDRRRIFCDVQSKLWNGQDAAFRITGKMPAALIFVSLPDGELA
jgi:predicted small integral membrane protein